MTTGDVVYSLRFSLIKILPEPGFDLGSTAGESCVLTARLHMQTPYSSNPDFPVAHNIREFYLFALMTTSLLCYILLKCHRS